MYPFGLGCIKLATPRGYKVHPKWYSDWSMCTVFYTTNIFEHRVESTVVFRRSFNIMARRASDAGVEECKGDSPPNDHTTSASSTPMPLGPWNLTPAQGPRSLKGRLVWLESGQSTPSERNKSACMMLTKNVCRGTLGGNTWEALVPLQVNTVCCTAI